MGFLLDHTGFVPGNNRTVVGSCARPYGYEDNDGGAYVYIPDEFRNLGGHIVGAKGSGKSVLGGRYITCSDYLRGIPGVVYDNGDTIDHLLYELFFAWGKLGDEEFNERLKRLVYVDMSGTSGRIVSWPFYYRFASETDYRVAERFPMFIGKVEPELKSASVQGLNEILDEAIPAGVQLVRNGWQITELEHVAKSIKQSLRVKLQPFVHDEVQRAIYGGSQPGIDWKEVIEKKQLVLLDFRGFTADQVDEKRRALLWSFQSLVNFIQYRGTGESPFSIFIDELYDFTSSTGLGQDEFARDLQLFINVIMRRHNIWLTLAHQEMNQFAYSRTLQQLLLGLDNQIVGKTNTLDDALLIARRIFQGDTTKIKRTEQRYDSYDRDVDMFHIRREHELMDEHHIDSPLYEQYHEFAAEIMKLKQLEFLLWKPEKRRFSYTDIVGDRLQTNIPFTLELEEDGKWIDVEIKRKLQTLREKLLARSGRPIADVLHEIAQRTQGASYVPNAPTPQGPLKRGRGRPRKVQYQASGSLTKEEQRGQTPDENPESN